jgi:hypothetical protein
MSTRTPLQKQQLLGHLFLPQFPSILKQNRLFPVADTVVYIQGWPNSLCLTSHNHSILHQVNKACQEWCTNLLSLVVSSQNNRVRWRRNFAQSPPPSPCHLPDSTSSHVCLYISSSKASSIIGSSAHTGS